MGVGRGRDAAAIIGISGRCDLPTIFGNKCALDPRNVQIPIGEAAQIAWIEGAILDNQPAAHLNGQSIIAWDGHIGGVEFSGARVQVQGIAKQGIGQGSYGFRSLYLFAEFPVWRQAIVGACKRGPAHRQRQYARDRQRRRPTHERIAPHRNSPCRE